MEHPILYRLLYTPRGIGQNTSWHAYDLPQCKKKVNVNNAKVSQENRRVKSRIYDVESLIQQRKGVLDNIEPRCVISVSRYKTINRQTAFLVTL